MVIPEKQQRSSCYKSVLLCVKGHDVREYVLYYRPRVQERTSRQQIAMLPGLAIQVIGIGQESVVVE